MQEKYYIDIDSNRKILGRYLLSFHGENIPSTAQEVTEEVFNTSIQENHNYLNEDLVTELREMRTVEEIAEQERLAKLPSEEETLKAWLDRPGHKNKRTYLPSGLIGIWLDKYVFREMPKHSTQSLVDIESMVS